MMKKKGWGCSCGVDGSCAPFLRGGRELRSRPPRPAARTPPGGKHNARPPPRSSLQHSIAHSPTTHPQSPRRHLRRLVRRRRRRYVPVSSYCCPLPRSPFLPPLPPRARKDGRRVRKRPPQQRLRRGTCPRLCRRALRRPGRPDRRQRRHLALPESEPEPEPVPPRTAHPLVAGKELLRAPRGNGQRWRGRGRLQGAEEADWDVDQDQAAVVHQPQQRQQRRQQPTTGEEVVVRSSGLALLLAPQPNSPTSPAPARTGRNQHHQSPCCSPCTRTRTT